MKLLIVDDQIEITNPLKKFFMASSFEVDTAANGKEAIQCTEFCEYDVIVMDIMMPIINGIDALKEIRRRGIKTPIILLSAKSTTEDIIDGLNVGADDYLTKPFSAKELLARIRALIRRGSTVSDGLAFGNVTLDPSTYTVKTPNGFEKLTRKEFQLLEYLIRKNNQIISTEQLLNNVWESDADTFLATVWVFISNLRKKLKNIKANIEIKASRGVGYQIKEIK